jgi:uncharacterized membrane protein YfcA
MFDLFLALLILAVAVGIGVISATVGVGGGFIMVPFMLAYLNYSSQQSVGTSALVIIFFAISSSVAYFKQKRVDYRVGAMAALLSVPAAFIGGYATKLVPSALLAFVLAVALVAVGTKMTFLPRGRKEDAESTDKKATLSKDDGRKRKNATPKESQLGRETRIIDAAGHEFVYHSNILPALPFFFLAGFLSGFLGVGGGVVIVPTLQIIVGIPLHLAVATSLFTMIFTSISSGTTHVLLGNVVFDYVPFFIIGIVIGSQVGARLAWRLKSTAIERVFGITMLLISIYLLFRFSLI